MRELKKIDKQASFTGIGGEAMEAEGMQMLYHYKDIALMGIVEVLRNVFRFKKLIKTAANEIRQFMPDAIIFIDFGGFNLRVAKKVTDLQAKKYYYITPKVWAWNRKRAFKIDKYTDQRFVILPFEKQFFEQMGISAHYVGNPLLDAFRHFVPKKNIWQEKKVIALIPGSRIQEIKLILPVMVDSVKNINRDMYEVVVSRVKHIPDVLYAPAMHEGFELYDGHSYDLLNASHAALVTSGTASLETALFKVPQVVCYKTSPLTYAIGSRLVNVPFISLPNLIAGREVVPELLQNDCHAKNLIHHLEMITDSEQRQKQLTGYDEILDRLGNASPSKDVAEYVFRELSYP